MSDLLFVTIQPPGPEAGGTAVSWNRLRSLQRLGHRVHLMLRASGGGIPDAVRPLLAGAHPVARRSMPLHKLANLRFLLRLGYVPKLRWDVWHRLRTLTRSHRFDAVILDHVGSAEYGRLLKETGFAGKIVLHQHNVEHLLLARRLEFTAGFGPRLGLRVRIRSLLEIERNLARYCDACLVLSDVDRELLQRLNPGVPVVTLPPSVDSTRYTPGREVPSGRELLFVGGLGWPANLDGLSWFLAEVFPRLTARFPDLHLTVVGRDPPAWLPTHSPRVTATGFVPDERPYVARARAVIVPIRFGSGVRIKILHCLAMGKAIVSTELGAEGIPARHGESIMLGSTADEFARCVEQVLLDDALAGRLARGGARLCASHFGDEVVDARLREVLEGPHGAGEPEVAALRG